MNDLEKDLGETGAQDSPCYDVNWILGALSVEGGTELILPTLLHVDACADPEPVEGSALPPRCFKPAWPIHVEEATGDFVELEDGGQIDLAYSHTEESRAQYLRLARQKQRVEGT